VPIAGTGRVQIHGAVAGASQRSAPCGGESGPESVFRFTPDATGCYELSTCGTSFDSVLAVDNAVCGGTQTDCHDDDFTCADGSAGERTFGFFQGGAALTVLLDSKQSAGGNYTLDVRPSGSCIF
jgi:hypothetical protein